MQSARILLADDDRAFCEPTASLLRLRGHEVELVEDGNEALRRLDSTPFDLVLADLGLAKVDALGLISEVRRRVPEQEVILVTQRSDVNAAVSALRAGASDYLLKPVEETELVERVNRSLERAALRKERAQLLSENLEFVRDQALYQRCLAMLSILDLERLQEICLADLCSVCDAQSGALWIANERGELNLRSYRGLVDRSALETTVVPRTSIFSERLAGLKAFEVPGQRLGKAFYLPLRASGELVGLVLCADKLTGDFGEEDFAVVRAIGAFAATALQNARWYSAVERLGLRDRDTAAYNLAYFVDYAGKEFYKARRYGRSFSVLTVSLDRLASLREQRGAQAADELARAVIGALGAAVRDSDVVAKAAEDEYYVLLPETDYLGALVVARRARGVFDSGEQVSRLASGEVSMAVGAATFPRDGQDLDQLLHLCRRRRDEDRMSLARKLDLGRLDFWSAVDLLLGNRDSPPLPADDRAGPTRRGFLPPSLFSQLQVELVLDIIRDPKARGLLYIGAGEVRSDLPAVGVLERVPADSAMRVYLLGRRADLEHHSMAAPVFLEGDERILKHEFLLLYTEKAAYALVQRKAARGAPWGFHTSDAAVVSELVSKLQERYDLQPL
ncbi:MAG: response regulator [Myxococcales bacterium]